LKAFEVSVSTSKDASPVVTVQSYVAN